MAARKGEQKRKGEPSGGLSVVSPVPYEVANAVEKHRFKASPVPIHPAKLSILTDNSKRSLCESIALRNIMC